MRTPAGSLVDTRPSSDSTGNDIKIFLHADAAIPTDVSLNEKCPFCLAELMLMDSLDVFRSGSCRIPCSAVAFRTANERDFNFVVRSGAAVSLTDQFEATLFRPLGPICSKPNVSG